MLHKIIQDVVIYLEKEQTMMKKKAFKWYLESAKNGNSYSQNGFGLFYDIYFKFSNIIIINSTTFLNNLQDNFRI